VVDRETGAVVDAVFACLPEYLRAGDLLVANESRVIPARIRGSLTSGGRVELLLVRRVDGQSHSGSIPSGLSEVSCGGQAWEVMGRPGRKLRVGTRIRLGEGTYAVVVAMAAQGRRLVRFEGADDFDAWLGRTGELPVPPYIKTYPAEPERYQTVYSQNEGSIAAPTAGLHFTDDLLQTIQGQGVEVRFVTLHVGPATFKPIQSGDLSSFRLEPEWGSISEPAAMALRRAKDAGRRVIAVGTTTTRLLEGVYAQQGEVGAWSGEIELFIRPPFTFKVVDALITNFHLPRSSLLMLVSAFAGRDMIRAAYEHAVEKRYRFYSFGDAMFIT